MSNKRGGERLSKVIDKVDFNGALPNILAKVKDVSSLDSWKAAYPGIEFMDVDEGLTGKPIDWSSRSPLEIAAYVAYMANPQEVEIDYYVYVDDQFVMVDITDSERVWYIWFYGCFDYLDAAKGHRLTDQAKDVLLGYAAQKAGPFEETILDSFGPDDLTVTHFSMRTPPVA